MERCQHILWVHCTSSQSWYDISYPDATSSSLRLLPLQQQPWLKQQGTVCGEEDEELRSRIFTIGVVWISWKSHSCTSILSWERSISAAPGTCFHLRSIKKAEQCWNRQTQIEEAGGKHQGIYCYQLLTVNNLLPGSILDSHFLNNNPASISLLVWDEEASISPLH